jgi:hypothetical protein
MSVLFRHGVFMCGLGFSFPPRAFRCRPRRVPRVMCENDVKRAGGLGGPTVEVAVAVVRCSASAARTTAGLIAI